MPMNRRQFLRALASTTALVAGGLSLTAAQRPRLPLADGYPFDEYIGSGWFLVSDPTHQMISWIEVNDPTEWTTGDRFVIRSRYIAPQDWKDWIAVRGA